MTAVLVGKYVIGSYPHPHLGIIEGTVDDAHYLVRFEPEDKDDMPETLQVVALSDMVRAGGIGADDEAVPWLFFDGIEQRAKFLAWMKTPPPDDPTGKSRVIPMLRRH
jgi:hypothetical protein